MSSYEEEEVEDSILCSDEDLDEEPKMNLPKVSLGIKKRDIETSQDLEEDPPKPKTRKRSGEPLEETKPKRKAVEKKPAPNKGKKPSEIKREATSPKKVPYYCVLSN